MRNAYKHSIGKAQMEKPLVISRHRWKDTVRSGSQRCRMWSCGLDYDSFQWGASLNSVMNLSATEGNSLVGLMAGQLKETASHGVS